MKQLEYRRFSIINFQREDSTTRQASHSVKRSKHLQINQVWRPMKMIWR